MGQKWNRFKSPFSRLNQAIRGHFSAKKPEQKPMRVARKKRDRRETFVELRDLIAKKNLTIESVDLELLNGLSQSHLDLIIENINDDRNYLWSHLNERFPLSEQTKQKIKQMALNYCISIFRYIELEADYKGKTPVEFIEMKQAADQKKAGGKKDFRQLLFQSCNYHIITNWDYPKV